MLHEINGVGCIHRSQGDTDAYPDSDAVAVNLERAGDDVDNTAGQLFRMARMRGLLDECKLVNAALHVSKQRGRGVATVYQPDMNRGMQERLELRPISAALITATSLYCTIRLSSTFAGGGLSASKP